MSFITELEKTLDNLDVDELRKKFYEFRRDGYLGYVHRSWGPDGFVPRPRTYLAKRQAPKEGEKNE